MDDMLQRAQQLAGQSQSQQPGQQPGSDDDMLQRAQQLANPDPTTQQSQPQAEPSIWRKMWNVVTGDTSGINTTGEATVHEQYTGNDHKVLMPKPGEDYNDYMKRVVAYGKTVTPDQINSELTNDKGIAKNAGIGAAKGLGQSAVALSRVGENVSTLGMSNLLKSQQQKDAEAKVDAALDTSGNEDQQLGANLESILEFYTGDEALKSLSLADKLAEGSKVVKFMEKYPRIASVLGDAIRTGTVGGAVGGAHGGKEGAVNGAVGGALLGGGLSAMSEVPGVVSDVMNGAKSAKGAISDATSSVFSKVKPLVSDGAAANVGQDALQTGIRSAGGDAATVEGVTPEVAPSIRSAVENTADGVYGKSKDLFAKIDTATGNRFQPIENALKENQMSMRAATTDEEVGKLTQERTKLETQQEKVFNDAMQNGVDKNTVLQARASYKKSSALYDLNKQIQMSADGVRPELQVEGSTPETVDPKKLFGRLNKMYDSGRLQEALGDTGAQKLINDVDKAGQSKLSAIKRVKLVKNIAKIAGLGVLAGGTGDVIRHFIE
jgi:hypothetical protein